MKNEIRAPQVQSEWCCNLEGCSSKPWESGNGRCMRLEDCQSAVKTSVIDKGNLSPLNEVTSK